MLVLRQKMIFRSDIQANPDILYVFGDNLDRMGFGGQAKEMRGEPNSFGIATKRSISHNYPDDYFFDNQNDVIPIMKQEFDRLEQKLQESVEYKDYGSLGTVFVKVWKAVVIPTDGLGTGLSRLPEYAPKALEYIEQRIENLKNI